MSEWRLFVSDGLVIMGTAALTLSVLGVLRIPDPMAKVHAAAKAVTLGTIVVMSAAVTASPADVVVRAILVAAFLLLTSAVSANVLGKLCVDIATTPDHDDPEAPYDQTIHEGTRK